MATSPAHGSRTSPRAEPTSLSLVDAIIKSLDDLQLKYPKVTGEQRKELEEARKILLAEDVS